MHTTMKAATSCLPVLLAVCWSAQAQSQPGPAPAPTYYNPGATPPPAAEPTAPAPAAPAPAAPTPAPAPTAQPAPDASASASWSFANGFEGETTGPAAEEAAPMTEEDEQLWRDESLKLQNNWYGSTGLLRISDAGSGAVGTFRISLLTEWFKTSGFLCTAERPCGVNSTDEDDASHFGTTAALSITPLPYLEAFASFRSYANSNSEGKPELLQVLGDSILGVKAFTPAEPNKLLRFGGEAQLLLVNGTGGVGLDGAGTGFRLRGLATADFAAMKDQEVPLRLYGNLGYRMDNSAKVVEDTEESRGNLPITRIERFGLGINRTDFVEVGLGAEGVFENIRPFLAYTIDLPLNRQDYICNKGKATTSAFNDSCLGENQSFSYMPSRLTVGARGYPFLKGFAPFAALDIGISGTSDFLEEVAPQAPWTLYVGVGYAVDTETKSVVKTETVEKTVEIQPPPQNIVRGKVLEKGTNTPVTNAIVLVQGSTSGGYATGPEGSFETRDMEPGTYTFNLTAEGYKPGQCTAQVTAAPAAGAPGGFGAQPGQPGADAGGYGTPGQPGGYGAPPGGYGAPPGGYGAPPGGYGATQPGTYGAPPGDYGATQPAAAPGAAPTGPNYVDVTCEMEALPKMGNVVGRVMDAEKSAPVANASIVMTDAKGKEYRASTDSSGNFRIEGVAPGEIKVQTEADKYLMAVDTAKVAPQKDAQVTIDLNPRPKRANVIVTQKQIIIRKQIHFETDSAVIKGDSTSLLEEIADVLNRNQAIKLVEVQGHTDNTGSREHNQDLSNRRASAVRDWLVSNGIETGRLEAKGYGQTRPIAPNVTARNRARNRRVQFVIKERTK